MCLDYACLCMWFVRNRQVLTAYSHVFYKYLFRILFYVRLLQVCLKMLKTNKNMKTAMIVTNQYRHGCSSWDFFTAPIILVCYVIRLIICLSLCVNPHQPMMAIIQLTVTVIPIATTVLENGKEASNIPKQPNRLKLIFITDEALPISFFCCSKIRLVENGRSKLVAI